MGGYNEADHPRDPKTGQYTDGGGSTKGVSPSGQPTVTDSAGRVHYDRPAAQPAAQPAERQYPGLTPQEQSRLTQLRMKGRKNLYPADKKLLLALENKKDKTLNTPSVQAVSGAMMKLGSRSTDSRIRGWPSSAGGWSVSDHYDHINVSWFNPKQGTPSEGAITAHLQQRFPKALVTHLGHYEWSIR